MRHKLLVILQPIPQERHFFMIVVAKVALFLEISRFFKNWLKTRREALNVGAEGFGCRNNGTLVQAADFLRC